METKVQNKLDHRYEFYASGLNGKINDILESVIALYGSSVEVLTNHETHSSSFFIDSDKEFHYSDLLDIAKDSQQDFFATWSHKNMGINPFVYRVKHTSLTLSSEETSDDEAIRIQKSFFGHSFIEDEIIELNTAKNEEMFEYHEQLREEYLKRQARHLELEREADIDFIYEEAEREKNEELAKVEAFKQRELEAMQKQYQADMEQQQKEHKKQLVRQRQKQMWEDMIIWDLY